MDVFNIHLYPPIKTNEPYRHGAYEESGFRGYFFLYKKIRILGEHLKYEAVDEIKDIFLTVPDNFLLPQEKLPYQILYPHPS